MMEYFYEMTPRNFEDFASGRVLYNAHGTTSFPVRLGSEIIQRCFQILEDQGDKGPYTLFDPCCGGAYLLTVTGLLHGSRIRRIYASDINPDVLGIAVKNLSLLTEKGLQVRKEQLQELRELYHKPSHDEALKSAGQISSLISRLHMEEAVTFEADITKSKDLPELCRNINVVMTDLPYGDTVSWESSSENPVRDFFEQTYPLLDPKHAVVAVIADKSQKLKHDKFKRLQHFKAGKRQVGIFEPIRD